MPGTVTLRDREGRAYGVPEEQTAGYLAQGFRPESEEEHGERLGTEVQHDLYGGALGAAKSFGVGALSGLTLGASDLGIDALGGGGALRGLSAEHPIAGGVGTFAGALAPALLTGGAAAGGEAGLGARILAHSPAGLVSKVGGAIGELGEGAGLAGRVTAGTAAAGAEGALYGGGQYLTETALQDKPLSAEGFVAGMGHGALFGAPIGAAGTLASGVLQRARSLFPRSEVSAAAAAGVKGEATGALSQAVRDGDAMAQAAERKLSDVEARTQIAQAGEGVTRRAFGEAHPQAIADQVSGAVDRQQVAEALQGYQQARQGLETWVSDEADPDLERALTGLRAGDLQSPASPVPIGEFGAPGVRGIKTPDEIQRIAEGSAGTGAAPALDQATGAARPRALRGGAEGTPAGASLDLTSPFDIDKTPLRFDPERRQYFNMDVPAEPMGGVPAQEIVQRGKADEGTMVGRRTGGAAETEPARAGIPDHAEIGAHEAKTDDYLERTVSAREIGARGYYEPPGGGEDLQRVANARRAIGEGQREAVKLNVSPEGKITVTDGRHRLAAAIEADAPIKVKWSTGTEPAEGDVLRGGAKAAPTDTLTGQLRGTAAKLGAGEGIAAMGAPARAEYAAGKAERTSAAAGHFRGKAIGRSAPWNEGFEPGGDSYAGSRMAAEERAAQAERVGRRAGVGDAAQRYRVASESRAADPLAAFGLESDATRLGVGSGEVPAEIRALALPERTAVDAGIKGRMGGLRDEAAIAKAIMRHNGKNVDIGPGLARAAKAIGDMEEAGAKLADVLGPEAPATAVENAKAYRAAIAKGQDQSAASSAKAGADLKTRVQPALDATTVDDDVTKALRQHDARMAAQATMAPGVPVSAAPAPAAGGGVGGRLADAGSALEVLRAIGAHVPAVSHIPIIGPILGLWLKARAVLSILGRKGGSIGKSTEGVIAAKAAATRDRIVAATGKLLEGGARAAGQAAHLAGPAALLGGILFPGGDKPASDKPRDLFEARSSEIARALQPRAIDQAIAQRHPTSDPDLHDAIVAQVQRGIAFLDGKRPKQTVLPGVLPGDGAWQPSMAAIEEFGKYVHAVNDPVSVLEDLAKGHPSAEGAETLRTVYPQLYLYAQKQLLQAAPEMAKTLPYPRRVMISILYQIPVDGTMQPAHAQYLQAAAPAAPRSPTPSTGPLRLGQQTMSPLDQRASGA